MPFALFAAVLSYADACGSEFQRFKARFRKQYPTRVAEQRAFNNFCENFQQMLRCPGCGLTSVMDLSDDQLAGSARQVGMSRLSAGKYADFVEDALPVLQELPRSVDLRECDLVTGARAQNACGACWAFSAVSCLENAVLVDNRFQKQLVHPFWGSFTAANLSLSEQFVLTNARTPNAYCDGGLFSYAANQVAEYFQTVELQANAPYAPDQFYSDWRSNIEMKPKLSPEHFYVPVKTFQKDNATVGAVRIFESNESSFGPEAIARIKSLLARGIAVSVTMAMGLNSAKFKMFTGGILYEKCYGSWFDHQVTVVGFGLKHKKPVWLVKNSWGDGWGDKGFFFAEIGKDSFCMEHWAYAFLPKHYDAASTQTVTGDDRFRGGIGFDKDGAVGTGAVLGAVAGALCAAGLAVLLGAKLRKRSPKTSKTEETGVLMHSTA